jgi:hypothetical protein
VDVVTDSVATNAVVAVAVIAIVVVAVEAAIKSKPCIFPQFPEIII